MDNGFASNTNGVSDGSRGDGDQRGGIKSSPSTARPAGHRRTLSNSILSRLNFLKTSQEDARPVLDQVQDGANDDDDAAPGSPVESAMALAQQSAKSRKRKGSLRKTALLGTGKLRAEGRERRNSLLQRRPSTSLKQQNGAVVVPPQHDDHVVSRDETARTLTRTFSYETPVAASSSDSSWSTPAQHPPSLDTHLGKVAAHTMNNDPEPALPSPLKSPTSESHASTTDDDEALTFSRPASGHVHNQTLKPQPASTSSSSSYFPAPTTSSISSITRRRSSTKPGLSPLSALPMDAYSPEEEWDYSETAWWGWVVLVVTWIVFVVGMGSCLDVWSWAWDVGQTPYAPPELEDDPTLPIVGYYPALIILTAVMAWVWVVVAWVGMKYFKHAKIQGDDT